jgi:SAM-dependent methyltransferase
MTLRFLLFGLGRLFQWQWLRKGNCGMARYNAAEHWSDVATKAGGRGGRGRLVAGDDAPYYRYKRRLFLQKFLSQIPTEDKSILEVGCGPGGNLVELLRRNPKRLVGCDVAPAMVEAARQEREAEGAEIVLIDGESLPFADQEFDLSFTVTVLMHNPEQRKAQIIGEMCRTTRSQIYLIEDTFPPSPSARAATTEDEASGGIGAYGSFFPRAVGEYADSCAKGGFALVDTQYLETFASHYLFAFLSTRLDKQRTAEGEGFSRLHWGVETAMQPLTRQLDRVIRRPGGELTLMVFERQRPF